MPAADSSRPRWIERPLPVAIACLALAWLAYGPSLDNGFYNDDALFLNHAARAVADPAALWHERPLNYFRPVWSAWVTAQWTLFGRDARGYHAVGILLHAATGLLVWLLARRLLRGVPGGATAALVSAAAFVLLFAHAEGTLWIAAHNSVLAAALCVAAVLAHLAAVDAAAKPGQGLTRATGRAALTAVLVLAALLTKEPAVVVLAWLPLVELCVAGPRSLLRPAAWARGAAVAAAVAVFLAGNARIGEAFADPSEGGAANEIRATFGFITADKLLGATAWMFSPLAHAHDAARWWHGALVLGAIAALLAWRRRDLLGPALCAMALLLTAMAPAAMTRFQQANGSRLYYFPTVGAALLLGLVCVALAGRRPRAAALVVALLFASLGAWNLLSIRALNADDYGPIGVTQTRLAEQLGELLPRAGPHAVVLCEPWIGNLMHLQEFVRLYADVPPARVRRQSVPREDFPAWLARQRQLDPGVHLLDWDEQRGLVPAVSAPPQRNDSPGMPRREAELPAAPRVAILRIEPPAER